MNKNKLWIKEDEYLLTELYSEGIPTKLIAQQLQRTQKAVINKAYVMGLSKSSLYTQDEIEYIKENYNKMNIRQLAENIGRGKNWQNVSRKAKELGLTNVTKRKFRHSDQPKPVDRSPKFKTDEERATYKSKVMKEWHATHEHPKGMLGKTHSKEYRARRSKIMKDQWANPNSYFNSEENKQKQSERMSKSQNERIRRNQSLGYSRGKGGTRADLGIYVRSSWEANVARYLNFLIKQKTIFKWEYEPDTFWFENIKRGTRSYTPDFKIWDTENSDPYYWEVKGYMDAKSKTKLKRMAKYYPDVKVVVIGKDEYNDIKKNKALIKNWE